MKLPKLCIGEGWPTDEMLWVVRLRNPLLMARVEPIGVLGMRLHCWPESARDQTTETKLLRCIQRMGEHWRQEVEGLAGMPSKWDFVFGGGIVPPHLLLLDNEESDFTGLLDTRNGRIWVIEESEAGERIGWTHVGPQPEAVDFIEAIDFYNDFLAAESLDESLERENI